MINLSSILDAIARRSSARAHELEHQVVKEERLRRLELRVSALEEPVKHAENTMTGDDYDRIHQNFMASEAFAKRNPTLAETYDLPRRVHEHNRRVEEAMRRPSGDTNTLIQHFDAMPEGDRLWALAELLDSRNVVLTGFRLSRKNFRAIRRELQRHNIDVTPFVREPS